MSKCSKGILYSKIRGYLTTLTEDSLGFLLTSSSSILSNSPFIIVTPSLVTLKNYVFRKFVSPLLPSPAACLF